MFMKYGSPLNWWQPFFGHDIKVNQDKIAEREAQGECSYAMQKEIFAWVEGCTKSRWARINPYKYRFLRKGDAAMFKLAWG